MHTKNLHSVQIGNTTIEYTIRESAKAKRMTIHITPDNMEVVVPAGTDEVSAYAFVERKRGWVYQKREELIERALRITELRPAHYRTGAKIAFRGRMMKLVIQEAFVESIQIDYMSKFMVSVPDTISGDEQDRQIRKALDAWITHRVEQDCATFIRGYSERLKLEPKGFRVKEQKHLWGSCGKDNIININWKLGRAPKKVLEYVVAHEICHLKYRNHSEAFWQLLRSVFNEVDECKKWLEENGSEGYDA